MVTTIELLDNAIMMIVVAIYQSSKGSNSRVAIKELSGGNIIRPRNSFMAFTDGT